MAISLDKLISVTSTVVGSSFESVKLIANVLTENELVPALPYPTMSFSSYAAVSAYFGVNSDEAKFAQIYFLSFTSKQKVPPSILFSRYVPATGSSAYMFSSEILAPATTVASIVALTTPTLSIIIDGVTEVLTLTQADFSAATGLSDVAAVVETALDAEVAGATVTATSGNHFKIQSPTGGLSIAASPDSDLAALMQIQDGDSPLLSQGDVGGDVAYNMDKITNINKNWIALTYCTRLTGDTLALGYPLTVEMATWVGAQENNFVFLPWSNQTQDLSASSATNLRSRLVAAGHGTRTPDDATGQVVYSVPMSVMYGATNNSVTGNDVGTYAAFYAGMGASINYNATNGKINFAGKRSSSLATNVSNDTDYDALLLQAYQIYGSFSSRATSYSFTENGSAGGAFLWLDNIYDSVWLADQIQNQLAQLLGAVKRIPYNTTGLSQIRSVLDSVSQQAVTNGVIEVGNDFTAAQIQVMIEQVGSDVSGIMKNSGYYVYFQPITAEQRAARAPIDVLLMYTNGGSINSVSVGKVFYV